MFYSQRTAVQWKMHYCCHKEPADKKKISPTTNYQANLDLSAIEFKRYDVFL